MEKHSKKHGLEFKAIPSELPLDVKIKLAIKQILMLYLQHKEGTKLREIAKDFYV